ncbi:hypothetical protein [Nissabacter sp. SGAir0207]|uniref:hypothetical protein n=1 Tax=Nissabacter sp. SGAir0207 TaxID=2126321 RepID=UPI0010CD054F|nr:hypothetical protein [Nissabacter sp. SGAir0207]QCR38971.1 hypothetical protein C1N62_22935 [Nissabacter sp. SGAir0207]
MNKITDSHVRDWIEHIRTQVSTVNMGIWSMGLQCTLDGTAEGMLFASSLRRIQGALQVAERELVETARCYQPADH